MNTASNWRKIALQVVPWIITLAALAFAFYGVNFGVLLDHIREADPSWICAAISLTVLSYLSRSLRWQRLFPEHIMSFGNSARVLFLGFFMNNILPARAGELVRAHFGAKLTQQSRTLVLATIASERLVDGLTISLMFVVFALGVGDSQMSRHLLIVAYIFAAAGIAVLAVLFARNSLLKVATSISLRFDNKYSSYSLDRFKTFLHGLSPLSSPRRVILIGLWSAGIWLIELLVYHSVAQAFSADLTFAQATLFLVAVNFASLIPSAPGAIGVIEAVASAALISIGIEREHALTMALAQHAIQYLVVGIPGAFVMLNWRKSVDEWRAQRENE